MLTQGRKLSALGWSLGSTRSERAAGRGVAGEVARPDSVALSGHVLIQTGSQGKSPGLMPGSSYRSAENRKPATENRQPLRRGGEISVSFCWFSAMTHPHGSK
jgi:hypothetical protein